MTERLLVKEAFAEHAFGDRITDPDKIRDVLASHPQHVLRERVPEAAAEKPPAKAPARPKAEE